MFFPNFSDLKISSDTSIVSIFSPDEIISILRLTESILMEENSLLEISAPLKIIGDLHGDFHNLIRLFDLIGTVPKEKLLFLGNYVDIGMDGIEVSVLLFCLKIRYRDRIFLLKGNHEIPAVNKMYGFYTECDMKYGPGIWWDFQCCFNRLPLACLVSQKVFCVHGGLSPELTSLQEIRDIQRPSEPISSGLEMDLLWSDPTNRGDGWFQSYRGISYLFGKRVVDEACKRLNISLIIRSHMVVPDGFEVMNGRRLITVFSVANYAGNAAAVLCVNEKLEVL
ncbi:hypothetical protein B9Z55_012747 [Caenorhabditis nigoni]|uniref:Serine/threonine-protein phosphatase n=1 Tax=Caenorhabditis nigoni TaxID=1611254 RepID=A0A2G5TYM0_9PELO|nr:hypothetical protein B9Z55_012747 [Caenorhabditis nigoni]